MKTLASNYFDKYKERYEKEYEAFKNGAYTEAEFKAWVQTQVARGEGYEKMADQLSKRMVEADKVASAYINDTTPTIYSLNHNYEAYRISQAENINFHLTDEQTVKELMYGNNHTEFKVTSVNPKRDYEWNSKKIHNALNSAILQGKSIDKLSDSFFSVMKSDRASAIRNARTSFTSAQNAGRLASYEQAEAMGIQMEKEWISTLDDRTRDTHQELDGQRVPYDEPFVTSEGNELMYPADPQGEPCEVYNCRCTMRAVLPKINDAHRMTYKEWLESQKPEEEVKEETLQDRLKSVVFTPANTIQEAEDYAKQFVNSGGYSIGRKNLTYAGLDVDTANEINRTLTQLFATCDIPKFDSIETFGKTQKKYYESHKDAPLATTNFGNLMINKEICKNTKTITKYIEEGDNAFNFVIDNMGKLSGAKLELAEKYKEAGRSLVGESLSDFITHEVGHHISFSSTEINKDLSEYLKNIDYEEKAVKISGYATHSPSEYIAESFLCYIKGDTGRLDNNIISIFEKVTK